MRNLQLELLSKSEIHFLHLLLHLLEERRYRAQPREPFWRRQVLLPMPLLAGGVTAMFVLVASLFFFVGRSGNELQDMKRSICRFYHKLQMYSHM